jgi:hypothetical protein
MNEPTEIVQRVTRAMHCSECGVEAAAACDCGAPYIPAGVAAAKAVAAHPEKSDRAIAAVIGVSDKTVGKARKATAEHSAVETRVGLDGKARKQPEKKPKPGNGLNALGKPYSPQYDPNYKVRTRAPVKAPDRGRGDLIQDMFGVLSGLNKSRRADFFVALWNDFRDELIEAQTVSAERALGSNEQRAALYNAPAPEVGAEIMKAKLAALDDGLDLPVSLRRSV